MNMRGNCPNYLAPLNTLKRSEKRIRAAFRNKESIEHMSVYSLPQNFSQAVFDYNILTIRSDYYVMLIVGSDIFQDKVDEEIINSLAEHIEATRGEIFSMDKSEVPPFYASKKDSVDDYKTLKIIREINVKDSIK